MTKFSSNSEPHSSLNPPVSDGVKAEDEGMSAHMAKSFLELEAQNTRLKEENRRLLAHNLELEEKFRDQLRSLEEKDEQIIRLKEDAMSIRGTEGRLKEKYERLNEKYQRLREVMESGERKWREEVEKIEEKRWRLEVENRKLEIDLQAARRRADGIGAMVEKMNSVEELESSLKEKDVMIVELLKKNEELEREKMKLEDEFGGRVIDLEAAVDKWVIMSSGTCEARAGKTKKSGDPGIAVDDFGCKVQDKGNGDLKGSGPISMAASLIEPKQENIEDDVQLNGPIDKVLNAPNSTDVDIIQISDDEDEEEEKSSSVAAPLSTAKCPENLDVPPKRKFEAVTSSVEEQIATKRCKSIAPSDRMKSWDTAAKMRNAFTTNDELCMASVCALYRKHMSLGVWKNRLDGNKAFDPGLLMRGVALGKLLTCNDPQGRMRRSLAELKREDRKGIEHCRYIAKHHYKELFVIYNSNLDPFFLP